MKFDTKLIIRIWRYIWLLAGLVLILFIISKAIFTQRILIYNLDFSQAISTDIRGWYPESRISQLSLLSRDGVDLIAEPVYMKVYSPVDFDLLTIEGSLKPFSPHGEQDIKLGLKQQDNSWDWQNIDDNDFVLNFDLENARVYRNELEFILSVPTMVDQARLGLVNNWQITFSK